MSEVSERVEAVLQHEPGLGRARRHARDKGLRLLPRSQRSARAMRGDVDHGVDLGLSEARGMKEVGHGPVLGQVDACVGHARRRAELIEAPGRRARAQGEDPVDPLVVEERLHDAAAEGLVRVGHKDRRH